MWKVGKRVYNYTHLQLPQYVEYVLALGPKFFIPVSSDQVHISIIIKDIETALCKSDISDEQKDICRARLVNMVDKLL